MVQGQLLQGVGLANHEVTEIPETGRQGGITALSARLTLETVVEVVTTDIV